MKHKGLVFFSSLFFLFGAVFLFRMQVVALATKVFLNQSFPNQITYQKLSTNKGKVILQGVQINEQKYQLTLGSADFEFDFQKALTHPKRVLALFKKTTPSSVEWMTFLKQYGMHLNIDQGILQLDTERYYFSFKCTQSSHDVGTLSIAHAPSLMGHPFLMASFQMRGDQLTTQLRVEEVPSAHLLNLAQFAFPGKFSEFEHPAGHVKLNASTIFDQQGNIDELSTRFSLENFEIDCRRFNTGVRIGMLRGDLNYPEGLENTGLPVWKRVMCNLTLEKGAVVAGHQFAVSQLEGNISLDPRENPSMLLKGELAAQERPLALKMKGKGAIHEDHAYWLEFGLHLDDRAGTECEAFLSVCRPELDALVLQLEANHLLPDQAEMLKNYLARSMPRLKEWEMREGSVGGKVVALFEEGSLAHFEVHDLIGEQILLQRKQELFSLFFISLQGEGRLFEEFNFEMKLPRSQFYGAKLDRTENDLIHSSMNIKFGQKEVETFGSMTCLSLNESVQFGFKSSQPFPERWEEIHEGWIRSEKLSPKLYAPLGHLFCKGLKVEGDVDLLGTYQDETLDLALQFEHFKAISPHFMISQELVGEKQSTEGRVRIAYHPKTDTFEGNIPLRQAHGLDQTFGLTLEDISGSLMLAKDSCKALITQADIAYENRALLKNVSFEMQADQEVSLRDLKGETALDSDKVFCLFIPYFNQTEAAFSLHDGKAKICDFEGKKEEAWEGVLSVTGFKEKIKTQFNWNRNNVIDLVAKGPGVELQLKKQGKDYMIEHFQFQDVSWKGMFSKEENTFNLSQFEMHHKEMVLRGEGCFFIDLPTTTHDFGVHSDLSFVGEVSAPVEMKFESKHPIKVAFSPNLGLIASDIELSSKDLTLSVEQIQHMFSCEKMTALKCVFSVSEDLINTCIDAKVLPGIAKDFRFCKRLNGETQIVIEKGVAKLEGAIKKGATWKSEGGRDLLFHAEIEKGKGKVALSQSGESEKLVFETERSEDGFSFRAIKGSLGRIKADLQKTEKKELKGGVHLDFSLFEQLFDLPLNRFVDLWHIGGGYQFDGVFLPQERLGDWTFSGKVKGKTFECGGYRLRSMEAKIQASAGQVIIENLDLTDEAGKMWVNEGALMRSGNEWLFSFPVVEIRSFQPSFLQKLGGHEIPMRPLMVKSATVHDLHGKIDDPMSITGSGSLKFTNVTKKGETLFPKSLPSEVLDQMGVDGGLFVPAYGEMDYQIVNGRLYLREIHSVNSFKNRSEFLPPRNGVMGYLDFKGNLFINLMVKQRDTLTPPLSLYIRGTWEEPEFSIK